MAGSTVTAVGQVGGEGEGIVNIEEALARTDVAGWDRPLRIEPTEDWMKRALHAPDCWSLVENDGTLIAIIGLKPDADTLLAAMNLALDSRKPS